jgi:hypothetical protein
MQQLLGFEEKISMIYLGADFHMSNTTVSFVSVTQTAVLDKTAILTIGLLILILYVCIIIIIIIIIIMSWVT